MNRWVHLLGALMLVLMLWTAGPAHAADVIDAVPVAANALGHFEGDKDEVPSDEHKGVTHHHSACGEHQIASWSDVPGAAEIHFSAEQMVTQPESLPPNREPDAHLRPPIA